MAEQSSDSRPRIPLSLALEGKVWTVIRSPDLLTAARAEALFTSLLSSASRPRPAEVAAAIRGAVRAHGGTRGCAVEVAGEFGDHPDTAALRMRWALQVVESTYMFSRVDSEHCAGVPELVLDRFEVGAGGVGEAGGAVAQVVEADRR